MISIDQAKGPFFAWLACLLWKREPKQIFSDRNFKEEVVIEAFAGRKNQSLFQEVFYSFQIGV